MCCSPKLEALVQRMRDDQLELLEMFAHNEDADAVRSKCVAPTTWGCGPPRGVVVHHEHLNNPTVGSAAYA